MYGGSTLLSAVTKLFQAVPHFTHKPTELKTGVIVTLYKGGNKDKRNPNSYRALSLCSSVLKLF